MNIFKVDLKGLSEHTKVIKANTLFGALCTAVNGDSKMMDEVTLSDFIHQKNTGSDIVSQKVYIDRSFQGNNKVWSKKVSWEGGYFLAATTLSKDKFTDVLKKMLELGIGADRSSGNGQFELLGITDVTSECTNKKGTKCYTLSDSLPDSNVAFVSNFEFTCYDSISMNGVVKPLMYMVKSGAKLVGDSFGIIGSNRCSNEVWTQGKSIILPCE